MVTVSGCVEEVMFQADFRSATLDPYSLADQCADFYTITSECEEVSPVANFSLS